MYVSEKDVRIGRMHGFKRGVRLFAESREDSHFKAKLSKVMRCKRPKKNTSSQILGRSAESVCHEFTGSLTQHQRWTRTGSVLGFCVISMIARMAHRMNGENWAGLAGVHLTACSDSGV